MTEKKSTTFTGVQFKKKLFKVGMLGDEGVGKTCLAVRFTRNEFLGDNVPQKVLEFKDRGDQLFTVQIWDIDHEDLFRKISKAEDYHVVVDCFLLVFSLVERESFRSITNKWMKEIQKDERLESIPMILVGLKEDLRNDERLLQHLATLGEDHKPIQKEEGEKMRDEIGAFRYLECSSLEGKNVEEIFLKMTTNLVMKQFIVITDEKDLELAEAEKRKKKEMEEEVERKHLDDVNQKKKFFGLSASVNMGGELANLPYMDDIDDDDDDV